MKNIIKQCPNCNNCVEFGKQKLINCHQCGAYLILVKIGQKLIVDDVTSERDKKVVNDDVQ